MRLGGLIFICGAAVCCAASAAQIETDDDPVDVLMRLRDQVLRHGRRIPNHTCVETMVRDRFEAPAGRIGKSCDAIMARRRQAGFSHLLRLETTDRLRLDVGMAAGSEIYSWAGAATFEPADLDEWLPQGTIGTGSLAPLLLSVFDTHTPRFVFEGEVDENGRALLEYSYKIPQETSQYRVKAHGDWYVTGYTGTLTVDPRTAELVRFTVRTEELNPLTDLCEVDSTIEYGTRQLEGFGYLLPAAVRQRFISTGGWDTENRAVFDSCREFRGESTVEFGAAPRGERSPEGAPAVLRLPAGLPMTIEITAPIDSESAAAGDRIRGRLAGQLRDGGSALLPEGAIVEGRLMRVEMAHPKPETTIALRWETVEAGGAQVPITLRPDHRVGTLKKIATTAARMKGIEIELPPPGETRYGVYHFPGERAVVPAGFQTEWITIEP